MVDSDSSLSSPPSTDDEMPIEMDGSKDAKTTSQKKKQGNILTFFKQKERSPTPPRKKREPSPEHIYVPEDNPDIAFIVMFRSRFNEAFPRGAPHVGPQDIEQGVVEGTPSSDVEGMLCALLGLVLNRKKPVEKGHYGRALEEAIQTQKSQWPRAWSGVNPISGGRSFQTMTAKERITLLHTLSLWSLNQNEVVKAMINDAYKSRTTKDRLDTNIPLSVQPWGLDGEKRRYWLVEGQNDTNFRVYRETDPHKRKRVDWFSVAGDIEQLRIVANKLVEDDGRKEAKALSERMINAIPRFEASEVKRKRREYRVQRNAAFTRPEPGFSMYEGRTRGKRLRYTFSDEEDFMFDSDLGTRRSARTSGRDTPAAPAGPTVTASGRQVRSRATGLYGETLHSGQVSDRASPATGDYVRSDVSEEPQAPAHGRSTRAAGRGAVNGRERVSQAMNSDEEDDATSWDGGDEDDDEPDQMDLDDDDDAQDDASSSEEEPQTLMVTLRYGKGSFNRPDTNGAGGALAQPPSTLSGTDHTPAQPAAPPLAGHGEPRRMEPVPAPVEAPVQTAPPPLPVIQQQPQQAAIPNGIPMPQSAAVAPAPPVSLSSVSLNTEAPSAPQGTLQKEPVQQTQYPSAQLPQPQPQPQQQPPLAKHHTQHQPTFPTTLPPPTPATNWQ